MTARHHSFSHSPATLVLALVTLTGCATAPPRPATPAPAPAPSRAGEVLYDVSFPNAVHHETRIAVTFTGLVPGQPLEALMSRSSPGRYALHEFAKNVYDVSAVDGEGRALEIVRPSPYGWDIVGHDGTVRITYTLYANHADGTYAGVDSTHAHYNMPAAFMYARGLEDRPIRITFRPIHGWKVATQLQPTPDPYTFLAPDLQYFMDSPTELSDFTLREWRMGSSGKAVYRMALHHTGTDAEADAYVEMARAVLEEQAAVFGEFPEFDFGTYTFLTDYLPWVSGDGMEHRNSTILTSTLSLEEAAPRLLGTLAHEAFHAWNMERLRDEALEPFAFHRANMSANLWFGEGFTSYYDALTRLRAGLLSLEDYVADMGRGIDAVVQSPARAYRGPADMSRMAPFVDAARSVDEVPFANTFVSYYTWGEVLGFGLDLTLRQRYDTSLDAYMRLLWERFGRHQADQRPTRPYDTADLREALAHLTGDPAFAVDFFDRFIESGGVPDYGLLVEPAGLLLRDANPDRGVLGLRGRRFVSAEGALPAGMLITTPLHPESAAARAGIASGDLVVSVDGVATTSPAALDETLGGRGPGDSVVVRFVQGGATKVARVTLRSDPTLELVTFEAAGLPVTDAVRVFRDDWAGSKAR